MRFAEVADVGTGGLEDPQTEQPERDQLPGQELTRCCASCLDIRLETVISAPAGDCFGLSLSADAHTASMRGSGERAIGGVTSGIMKLGDAVTWRARDFGIAFRMTAAITEYQYPSRIGRPVTARPLHLPPCPGDCGPARWGVGAGWSPVSRRRARPACGSARTPARRRQQSEPAGRRQRVGHGHRNHMQPAARAVAAVPGVDKG
jgi:hypothetical protein